MINTWGELLAAIKTWWHTPLEFKRKQVKEELKEDLDRLENLYRPTLNMDPGIRKRFSDQYIEVFDAYRRHQSMIDPFADQLTEDEKKDYSATWGDPLKRQEFIRRIRMKYGFDKPS